MVLMFIIVLIIKGNKATISIGKSKHFVAVPLRCNPCIAVEPSLDTPLIKQLQQCLGSNVSSQLVRSHRAPPESPQGCIKPGASGVECSNQLFPAGLRRTVQVKAKLDIRKSVS